MRKHLVIVSFISAALAAILIALLVNYDILPRTASEEHAAIGQLMKVLAVIAMVFFSIIITVLVYSVIFFRRRRGETGDGPPIKGNSRLEIVWTAVPLAIVIGLSVYGGIVLASISKPGPPQTELEVNVLAFRFGWQFSYPQYNNVQSFDLGLEVDRHTVFYIKSRDVVHSFWIPEFGPKMDAVPGLTTTLRYTPTKTGKYTVLCAELCGYGHSFMIAPVDVMSSRDFTNWVSAQATPTATPISPAPVPGLSSGSGGTVVNLTARNLQFDKNIITVNAGSRVTIQFDNEDAGILHNFAAYTDSTAAKTIFTGEAVSGPKSITYNFTVPATPGNCFFRCDVHPATMNGTLIVK